MFNIDNDLFSFIHDRHKLSTENEPSLPAGTKHRLQVTSHRSLFYQYRKNPKHSLKLDLGLIRPKQSF